MHLAFPILYITFKFLISFYNFAKLYFPCTFASLNRKIEFDIYISTHTEDDKKSGKCFKKMNLENRVRPSVNLQDRDVTLVVFTA